MINNYKNAMNRVKASNEFKIELLKTLESTPKIQHHKRFRPYVLTAASAAALALIVTASVVLFPSVNNQTNIPELEESYYISEVLKKPDLHELDKSSYSDETSGVSENATKQPALDDLNLISEVLTPHEAYFFDEGLGKLYIVSEIIHN